MAYTTINDPTAYFQAKTYTGNGSTNAITLDGVNNMQPDWVWIKDRERSGYNHNSYDSVRGATKLIWPNLINLENTYSDSLTAFNSNGFTLGADSSNGEVNVNTETYISWNWSAGTSFSNDASATGVGTIDSSGTTNQTAGFSIVSWTGTGSAGTIAHNLGSVPEWYLLKVRSGATNNWAVYHHKSNANPEQYALYLDGTSAATDDSGLANDTAPTSTVFSVTSGNYANQSGYNYIGYFFSEVQGYSKFGSYTGNGNADGPFIYTGFKPAWVLQKNISATQGWQLQDNKRNGFNGANKLLQPHTNQAESDVNRIDILSNGFKVITTDAGQNSSGATYVYMTFAESPFVTSTGIPTTAR